MSSAQAPQQLQCSQVIVIFQAGQPIYHCLAIFNNIVIKMNRFQRCASNYAYYGYLNRFTPQTLRTYQSERFHSLGRKGAYDTLVLKMATDHVNYEDQMNQQYKTPTPIVNLYMRVAWFLFCVPAFMMLFNFDDMTRVFVPHKYNYIGNQSDTVIPTRYETLYVYDRLPKF